MDNSAQNARILTIPIDPTLDRARTFRVEGGLRRECDMESNKNEDTKQTRDNMEIEEWISKTLKTDDDTIEKKTDEPISDDRTCARCLVKKNGMKCCGRCGIVHYCSRDCQTQAWEDHKKHCVLRRRTTIIEKIYPRVDTSVNNNNTAEDTEYLSAIYEY